VAPVPDSAVPAEASNASKPDSKPADTAAGAAMEEPKQDSAATDAAKDEPKQDSAATDAAKDEVQDIYKEEANNKEEAKHKEEAKPAGTDVPTDTAKDATKDATKDEPKQDAAAPAAEPADKAVAAPAPERSPVAAQLSALITGKKLDRFVSRKDDRAGIDAFYSARNYEPIWASGGAANDRANDRAKAAKAYLAKVDAVGLDPREYPAPDFASAATPEALAEAELRMSAAVLTYARHAQTGRVHFSRVAADISFKLDAPGPAAVLANLAGADDAGAALDGYNPPFAEFKALKAELARLRGNGGKIELVEDKSVEVRVLPGNILRPGMKDDRVLAVRQRLKVPGDKDNRTYDDDVFEAVKAFQLQADIGVDGMLGSQTVRALNGEQETRGQPNNPIDTVIANMDRLRWLPRKLGNATGTYVVVNAPDYSLSLFHEGKLFWKTRLVVGKPSQATPMISAEMKFITVNPTWNVPPSIIENEYLPALAQDPYALERIGLKIYQTSDGTVRVYQPPGAGNALGRIRFNFPNKFLVYQHDTPDKHLFKRDKRAYSHGCMRVQDPLDYAVKLLSIEVPNERYTKARLESMYGDSEININFPKPIPVHLTYQTAFAGEDGKIQYREDVYRRDAKMIQILNGSERRVADLAMERARDTSAAPVRMPVGTYGSEGGGGYGYGYRSGPLDWLFGAPPRQRYRPRGFIGPGAGPNGRYSSWR
jgi:murein L,D-transpeptidase YcbB/YkuD